MPWYIAAIFSAIFAALTSVFAKIGIKDVNSNLATAIRTSVILIFTWGIAYFQKSIPSITSISKTSWIFLILSALATGASWLFYFYALKVGDATKVVPIDKMSLVLTIIFAALLLHEKFTWQIAFGAILMTAGTLIIAYAK